MTRSFSRAPGGWVGDAPGRSGDTQIEELASERKQRMEQERKEIQDLMQLLFKVDNRNTPLQPQQVNSPSSIFALSDGLSFNIKQEPTRRIDKPQFLKQHKPITEERVKDNTHQTSRYLPDIFDFMEECSLAGVVDKFDYLHHQQTASPLAQRPRPRPRRVAPVIPVKPLSQLSHIACNPNVHHRQSLYLPTPLTPPYSPFRFTCGDNLRPFPAMQQHGLGHYSSPSAAPQSDSATSSLASPMPIGNLAFGSSYPQTSLIQAMNIDQSPHKFASPAVDGIDPFVDRARGKVQGQHSATTPPGSIPIHKLFKPSRALLDMPRSVDPELAYMAERVGLDLGNNYKGDITKEHIYNAIAPISDNCALHVIGLPADITLKEIFKVIVGKVFSFQLHAPVPGKWAGCGARLVFTNRPAAEEFFCKSRSGLGFIIRGHQIRVLWNRDPCRPQTYADRHQSRVLQITGPNNPNFSAAVVEQFFSSKLLFKLVDRKEWLTSNGVKVVELHFPSILGQSRPAMKQFYEMLDETEQRNVFKIHYAPDPCESVGQGTAAFIEHYRY